MTKKKPNRPHSDASAAPAGPRSRAGLRGIGRHLRVLFDGAAKAPLPHRLRHLMEELDEKSRSAAGR